MLIIELSNDYSIRVTQLINAITVSMKIADLTTNQLKFYQNKLNQRCISSVT